MTSAAATTAAARRPLALQGVLLALIVLALIGGFHAATQRAQFFAEFPRFTPVLWALYLGWVPVGIASKVGMLLWRRWAFWLTLRAACSSRASSCRWAWARRRCACSSRWR